MRLTVFGSTGKTGQIVIERALAEGHSVVAYARSPEKLDFPDQDLTIIEGELDEPVRIDEAIAGSDAVISLLGPMGRSPGQPIALGTSMIIESMQRHNVQRLVVTATPSARDDRDGINVRYAFMVLMVRLLIRSAYEDVVQTADTVRSSDLDWTIVRLPMLTSDEGKGKIRAGYLGQKKIGNSVSRYDLAEFLLDLIVENQFIGEAPVVSN